MSLAEELRAGGHDAVATPGEKSQFDILADGDVVFSKQELGRFPDDGEVASLLSARG